MSKALSMGAEVQPWNLGTEEPRRLSNINDGPVRRRRNRGLLLLAQRDDQRNAARPRRQHVDHRKELDDERRQQQRMEAEERPGDAGGHDIENLVGKRPAERPE